MAADVYDPPAFVHGQNGGVLLRLSWERLLLTRNCSIIQYLHCSRCYIHCMHYIHCIHYIHDDRSHV
jgi:hypothetical protein